MKKLLSIVVLIVVSSSFLLAQTNKEEVDFYQSIFGAEKKALIAEFLKLDQNDPFWELYDAYETERKELGKARLVILENYASNYLTLTDTKTDEIIADAIKQSKALDKLIVKYYKKVKKTSGSRVAAQFYHVENYLLSAVRMAVLENIPAIGEFN